MSIEILFYKLLSHYKDELPQDLLAAWQPKRIIDALIECNPDVEQNLTIKLGFQSSHGEPGKAFFQGHQKAVTRRLLRQYYHKLGSYLHTPTSSKIPDQQKMRSFLLGAAQRVEEHCRETTIIANISEFHAVACVCGRHLKRNVRAAKLKPYLKCPDEACEAEYDLLPDESGKSVWKLRELEFVCPKCETSNWFGAHLVGAGSSFKCVECETSYKVDVRLVVFPADQEAAS